MTPAGIRAKMGDPTGNAEEAPMLPAESKFLERKGTDNIYHEKQQSMRIHPKKKNSLLSSNNPSKVNSVYICTGY